LSSNLRFLHCRLLLFSEGRTYDACAVYFFERLFQLSLNGVHNNKSEDADKNERRKRSNEEGGEQKVASAGASIVGASILPDSDGSKQQKAKKKGPALKGGRL